MTRYFHYFVRQRGVKHEVLCEPSRSQRCDMTTEKIEEVTCPRCLRVINNWFRKIVIEKRGFEKR